MSFYSEKTMFSVLYRNLKVLLQSVFFLKKMIDRSVIQLFVLVPSLRIWLFRISFWLALMTHEKKIPPAEVWQGGLIHGRELVWRLNPDRQFWHEA